MGSSWIALLPFLIVIPISIVTRQVQPGLFAGLILGCYLKQPDFLGGIKTLIGYILDNIVKTNNIRIIVFLYVFAGLISLTKMTGGIKGFVHLVGHKVKTKGSAMLLTWISTIGTFSDPDFRIVTIAPIMKALRQRLKMTKQEIGFVIEATSNPVVALIPVATAFVGYMVSITGTALQHEGIKDAPYTVYVRSIPFNFFSFVILAIGIYYSFFHAFGGDISKVDEKEKSKSSVNQLSDPNEQQGEEGLEECHRAFEKETPTKPWNLILPLTTVLVGTIFLSWWDGRSQASNIFEAFLKADALGVMLEAVFITLILSIVFYLVQKFSMAKIVTHFIKGGNELVSVIIMLALVWALSAVSEDLGFSKYIASHVVNWIPHTFIAPAMFLLGGIISYFIGSSWGTWGLLMPLGVTLAHQSGANIQLVIGAVFSSGTFGAFASPLSDNTVTLCTILDLPVLEYAQRKLKPALVAAAITTILFSAAAIIIH
ncbi:Na+/H+ antiporter [Desulfosporosinus orientis DSM 765]|uniref:Na+/H+ antiporter n=1 Tax=Desulfosporosinus orientis (strain ATCC 19365 / DSM 765 / NCIMB 8382 / VKM B-1628 / Singapore I) TaxID=768706 RepID=G7W8E1_DESOD|nr:Na+/H+ antiporter NhaC family protein [Desulfosporosinus orientis]AET67081.1 Na+/H+ antiporter [Desulfosporosinus orientis DSM 765]